MVSPASRARHIAALFRSSLVPIAMQARCVVFPADPVDYSGACVIAGEDVPSESHAAVRLASLPAVAMHHREALARMREDQLFGQVIQGGLMIFGQRGKAALVLVETIQLRKAIPKAVSRLGTLGIRPIDAPELAKRGVLVASRLHPLFLGSEQTGKLKLIPNHAAQLKAEQHVRVGIEFRNLPFRLRKPQPAWMR